MGRKKLDLINLPQHPKRLQELIEAAAGRSIDAVLRCVRQMPCKRNALLRSHHEPRFVLTTLSVKQGALIQSRGDAAKIACDNCQANKGPFTESVLLDNLIGGRCANCFATRPKGTVACYSLQTEGISYWPAI